VIYITFVQNHVQNAENSQCSEYGMTKVHAFYAVNDFQLHGIHVIEIFKFHITLAVWWTFLQDLLYLKGFLRNLLVLKIGLHLLKL